MAWNTDTDIYLVPTDGSLRPSSISSYNKGYDKHPKFSLDGSWLAWLQMPTPGYEADSNRIALYSIDKESRMSLQLNDWDRSPESITWTKNYLVISAQELGRVKLFKVTFDGQVEPWISEGSSHQLTYIENYGFVFVKNSLTATSDIFTSVKDEIKQVTNLNQAYMKDIQLATPEVICKS
jgi:dipeptidyl aminopeptidase/acylaminoacyl peptidase